VTQLKTKQYNVTDLSPQQRRQLFRECMAQAGFQAFIKNQNNKQTHYTFQYKN
jgi:hypothetical protein